MAPKTGAAVTAAAPPADLATSFLVSVVVDIIFFFVDVEAVTVFVESTVIFPEEDFEEVTVLVEILPDEVTVFPALVVVNDDIVIVFPEGVDVNGPASDARKVEMIVLRPPLGGVMTMVEMMIEGATVAMLAVTVGTNVTTVVEPDRTIVDIMVEGVMVINAPLDMLAVEAGATVTTVVDPAMVVVLEGLREVWPATVNAAGVEVILPVSTPTPRNGIVIEPESHDVELPTTTTVGVTQDVRVRENIGVK